MTSKHRDKAVKMLSDYESKAEKKLSDYEGAENQAMQLFSEEVEEALEEDKSLRKTVEDELDMVNDQFEKLNEAARAQEDKLISNIQKATVAKEHQDKEMSRLHEELMKLQVQLTEQDMVQAVKEEVPTNNKVISIVSSTDEQSTTIAEKEVRQQTPPRMPIIPIIEMARVNNVPQRGRSPAREK